MGKDVRKILALLLITAVILAFMTSCSFIEDLTGNLNIGEEDVTDDIPGETDDNNNVIPDSPETPPSTPNEPNEPSTPSEPSEPSEPSTPSEPPAPSEPTEPSEPSTPSEPTEPNEPEEPSEPNEPSAPTLITISKTAEELAALKGSTARGTVMSGTALSLDSNVTIEFSKGSANNDPAYYDPDVRVYQNGGVVVIKSLNGRVLDTIVITTGEYSGGSSLSVTGGTYSKNGNLLTIKANSNATTITISTGGNTKTGRLYVSDVSVTYLGKDGDGEVDEPNAPDTPSNPGETTYTYNDFTSTEKTTYRNVIGFVIPFLPTNDYYFEDYNEDGYVGVYYSALCEEESRFTSYLALFSIYTEDGTYEDEYGDTWYLYINDGVYVDVCYYQGDDGNYYVDVGAYFEDGQGGGGSDDNNGESGGNNSNADLITNAGAGLPNGENGVYNVDFTKADKVKDVTDQGYYLEGCPTTGSPGVLVIPVEFSDVTASSKGYTISKIENAFKKDGVNDYYSVYDYYFTSSYGQLTLDITVLDEWFRPSKTSTYYANQTTNYNGTQELIGDQMIMNEALAYLESKMDLSRFDSDDNGTIDAVVLITTLEINSNKDFYWAYRYWNTYTNSSDNYYEYDGVSANDYLWAPYQFLYETYNSNGDVSYNSSVMNTYTFIHEFGHVLGSDDYYDTAYVGSPMGGYDVMDAMLGDHNAYTKFNYGWLTSSRLVVASTSVTLTLEDFSKNGDTILLASNWKDSLGAYQEYYVISYYTNTGLNAGDGGYFDDEGIVVYKINASLFKEVYEGETYYDVYNNNTDASDSYGTADNLIEYVLTSKGEYVYGVGDSLNESDLPYTFTIDALTDDTATITFTKK